jgi:protein-glutamine gamma-glutamyltransferase
VLEFNLRAQLSFLRDLGIESPNWRQLGWAFAGALLLWLLWVSSTLRRSMPRVKPDRIARAWLRATRKLERIAPPRAPCEGALSYAQRVAGLHPHLAASVMSIARRYTQLRYGPEAPHRTDVAALEREVRSLAA